ncbi:MAG: TonB family protein [Desulfurobacteriaceae bacterium]
MEFSSFVPIQQNQEKLVFIELSDNIETKILKTKPLRKLTTKGKQNKKGMIVKNSRKRKEKRKITKIKKQETASKELSYRKKVKVLKEENFEKKSLVERQDRKKGEKESDLNKSSHSFNEKREKRFQKNESERKSREVESKKEKLAAKTIQAPEKSKPSNKLLNTPIKSEEKPFDKKAYISLVLQEIERKKFYPPLAKRFGMEGKVWIKFIVNKKGKVLKVEVFRSSGKKILDKAALELISRCSFPPLPQNFKGETLEIEVAIRYSLEE